MHSSPAIFLVGALACATAATDEQAQPAAHAKRDPDLSRFIEAKRRQEESYEKELKQVWPITMEVNGAVEEFRKWDNKLLHQFGDGIINSIPSNSIYFGGTDAGQFIVTALSKSHQDGQPFFTLTQNALPDDMYLDYLRSMYGKRIHIPGKEDSERALQTYIADVQRRSEHDRKFPAEPRQLRPGEEPRALDDAGPLRGQMAVIAVKGLLSKIIFDKNPDREFYVEEGFPLDWMNPHLSPQGLILKINREPLPQITEETARKDHEFWSRYTEQLIGWPITYDPSVKELCDFVEKVYLRKDLKDFKGEPAFPRNDAAQRAFSKLRSSIAGLYHWRVAGAKTATERQRMFKEAEFGFKQAYALCPASPESLFRYINLLVGAGQIDDAILLATTALKLDPANTQVENLIKELDRIRQPQRLPEQPAKKLLIRGMQREPDPYSFNAEGSRS
jgi:tetratricopeptide (TPR) repeat protein